MARNIREMSIVQYLPHQTPDSCGYCKQSSSSKRFGMWAFKLTVADYQALIDRGWRRCGLYCYKPILKDVCCSLYTIRCDTTEFRLSRSQKRILKKMAVFLKTGEKPKSTRTEQLVCDTGLNLMEKVKSTVPVEAANCLSNFKEGLEKSGTLLTRNVSNTALADKKAETNKTSETANASVWRQPENSSKAKQRRILRKKDKLMARGLSEHEISQIMLQKKRFPVVKKVEDFIDNASTSGQHNLEVRLVRSSPRSPEFLETYEAAFNLYKRYQVTVHNDPPSKISRDSYDRFLVDSPLIDESDYGSYHQQYWLDGNLIAVGVVDILPACVSSVYLFYDPDYTFLNLGTYGAIREIYFTRSLTKSHPELSFYYMGFYIHSCIKMRYKGAFKPSFLLCPEVYSWHPIEVCLPKINTSEYSRLNENSDAFDVDGEPDEDAFNNIPFVYGKKLILVGAIPSLKRSTNAVLKEYCSLVGKSAAGRMILQLD